MQESADTNSKAPRAGHLKFLTGVDNLQLMGLLCDLLSLLRGFQVACQSDSITLDELERNVEGMITDLQELQAASLLGGWEAEIVRNLKDDNGTKRFYAKVLWKKAPGRRN